MIIDKSRVDGSLKKVRGLYRDHAAGGLTPSSFTMKARAELHTLFMLHTQELVEATAARFTAELRSFQPQFGLVLEYHTNLTQVSRSYRGIRASIHIHSTVYTHYRGSVEVFIGPFDEWDRVAIHTTTEREVGGPSLYTKRLMKRWKQVRDFDFPAMLQWIKEETQKPEPQDDADDIPF